MKKVLSCLLTFMIIGVATSAKSAEYVIDAAHSSFNFSVAHLVITKTNGSFGDFEGKINFEPDNPEAFKADVIIQTASIDTNDEKRDEHLRSGDFFDAEQYPTITFSATKLMPKDNGEYVLSGDLTMKGFTKSINIPVFIQGPVNNPFGGTLIGLEGETVIDRQDWGISWNKSLDNGGVVVGNDVRIKVAIEAHAK